MPDGPPRGRSATSTPAAALIVAHPGHELRVHGWLETAKPVTFVLTKGDGRGGVPRIASTSRVLESAGAKAGSIYGRLEDTAIYAALLRHDHALFLDLLEELAGAMVSHGICCVAADAEEGYNPSHDVCRYLAAAATALVARATSRPVRDFDFTLEGAPGACPEDLREESIWLELDEDALARKLAAARNYPELQFEVARALDANGAEAFRIECLRPALVRTGPPAVPPFYEEYGERQVTAGHYKEAIGYERHVLPLKNELRARAAAAG